MRNITYLFYYLSNLAAMYSCRIHQNTKNFYQIILYCVENSKMSVCKKIANPRKCRSIVKTTVHHQQIVSYVAPIPFITPTYDRGFTSIDH